jgi:tryptophan 7-halogenase
MSTPDSREGGADVMPSPAARRVLAAQVLRCSDGQIVVCRGEETFAVRGLDPDDLAAILAAVDREADLAGVVRSLSAAYEEEDVRQALQELDRSIIQLPAAVVPKAVPSDYRLAGLLAGPFGDELVTALASRLRSPLARLPTAPLLSAAEGPARGDGPEAVLYGPRLPGPTGAGGAQTVGGRAQTLDELAAAMQSHDLVVCHLDGAFHQSYMDVAACAARVRTPVLFVSGGSDGLTLGPLFVPGKTACFSCAQFAIRFGTRYSAQDPRAGVLGLLCSFPIREQWSHTGAIAEIAATEIVANIQSFVGGDRQDVPDLLTRARRFAPGSHERPRTFGIVLPGSGCPVCDRHSAGADDPAVRTGQLAAAAALAIATATETLAPPDVRVDDRIAVEPARAPMASVGVIGGGTAGYLTALALKKKRPDLEVTLVESSAIPVIGVGEATTPVILYFLHNSLGLDMSELYARVEPTWKLGIRFYWGLPGKYHYNYPFSQGGRLLEAHLHAGDLNRSALESALMDAGRAPIIRQPGGRYRSLFPYVRYAYHLDNRRFVHYLQDKAAAFGVNHIDTQLVEFASTPGGDEIAHVQAKDGRRLSFDLYVDCTGFRSSLMGGALKSPFIEYRGSLFTNGAVVASVPHDRFLAPYTYAESMDGGWCWNIPTPAENHRGYVFSADFYSPEEAEREMRQKNPRMGDAHLVKFRSGRHEHFWKGNVVAIGNAYAFVEPLESTGLHMIIMAIRELLRAFPASKTEHAFKRTVNRRLGEQWDYLRWFLAIHYKFNRKFDTPFWRACRSDADTSGIDELIEQYREQAPLSYRRDRELLKSQYVRDDLFGLGGIDTLLLGQGVATERLCPPLHAPDSWRWQQSAGVDDVVRHALTQYEALQLLRDRPDLLPQLSRRDPLAD